MLHCRWCKKPITQCRMDRRGLCIKDPKSSGKVKRRTKNERETDRSSNG